MPEQPRKIKLDANIMREPQSFGVMGDLAEGIARDLVIWGAWNDSQHAILHLPQFCEMFGYNRRHLLRPISEEKRNRLKKVVKKEHLDNLSNSLGWTLMMMLKANLVFYTNKEGRISKDISPKTKENRYEKLSVLANLKPEDCLKKRKTGSIATMEFDAKLIANSRKQHYQVVDLEDYLSLKTPGGHPDDQARKMYLRMTWKRQFWDAHPARKGYRPSQDEYDDLKAVAGLYYGVEKRNASLLRALLNRVGELKSVQLTSKVELNGATGVYEVTLKKHGEPLRKKSKPKAK